MSHLFISHLEEDSELALELAAMLEEEGFTVWEYKLDVPPAADYVECLERFRGTDAAILITFAILYGGATVLWGLLAFGLVGRLRDRD